MTKHLRTVGADERKKPATPKNITAALEGSSRDVLAAMRSALARQLDAGEVSSNSIASAYKELRELDRLIRLADAAAEEEAATKRTGSGEFDASAV